MRHKGDRLLSSRPADTVARSQPPFQATVAGSSPTCQRLLQVVEAEQMMVEEGDRTQIQKEKETCHSTSS